jgi:hypothetical protein
MVEGRRAIFLNADRASRTPNEGEAPRRGSPGKGGDRAQQRLESKKQEILDKLKDAGGAGLTKGALGVKNARSAGGKALQTLEDEGKVANLGTTAKTRYVLMKFYRPLELACARIESNAKEKGSPGTDMPDLLSRKDLERGCTGQIRNKVEEAVDGLVKAGKLLRFRRGRTSYYLHAERVRGLLGEGEKIQDQESEPERIFSRSVVLDAYRRVKDRLGYSHVEISELQKEIGVPMDQVKAFLLEENRGGNAILSLGDWSLSSEETRSGAIQLLGKPHLLVRFRDGV